MRLAVGTIGGGRRRRVPGDAVTAAHRRRSRPRRQNHLARACPPRAIVFGVGWLSGSEQGTFALSTRRHPRQHWREIVSPV